MPELLGNGYRVRKNYAKIRKIIDIPNLINIQKNSYENFLQKDVAAEERLDQGLQGVFKNIFPIEDFSRASSLEFVKYRLEAPKYEESECRHRGMTYAAPLQVTIRLVVWNPLEGMVECVKCQNRFEQPEAKGACPECGGDLEIAREIREVKEQEVYFGEIPLMTEQGSFIINGTERVIVSQLHRSPGVFFDHDKGKTHSSGKLLYFARVIPYRGSWIDLEFDHKDILHVRIDRRRKMHATVLLKALGYSVEELLNKYYKAEIFRWGKGEGIEKSVEPDLLEGQRVSKDIRDPKSGELIIRKGRKITKSILRSINNAKIKWLPVTQDDMMGRVVANDIVNKKTGEVIAEANQEMTPEIFESIKEANIKEIRLLFIDNLRVSAAFRNTLLEDKTKDANEALIEIYRRLRPGDPPSVDAAKQFFDDMFFSPARYDLSKVGRLKINHKLGLDVPMSNTTLTPDDIVKVVGYLLGLKDGKGEIDDIDHLGNRRVRAVGELLENQFRIGLVRMEKAIKERMSFQEVETLMPHDLVNAKPVSAVVKEFFGSSQLSQFMDQTNPLSEVTHKRRLSALGPGGLTRERAGFEVRDVHSTHYGRICPVETPEGPNIGLIASLSTYARVNEFGFIETPYRMIKNGKVSDEVQYMSALEEAKAKAIAQANAPIDDKGKFVNKMVSARVKGEFMMVPREHVDMMDVSPNQLVSVAAALIPFLEHDDANRALMGSNMQRQAVPLLKTDAPIVGTGMESVVAHDAGVNVVSKRSGVVESVDSNRIVVKCDEKSSSKKDERSVDIYNLIKYQRSNQNTTINQRPIVRQGDRVKGGTVIADGPATEMGELALGKNTLVAFMPWGGYNFEDSILVSEKLVRDDTFTSIHIEEFECVARDTKLGKEEITRDIPNVGEDALKNLDNSGIVRIGAEVKPNDILVGKITPKGETMLSPEEKLLRAIFGEKAGDVRDTSMRVPPGIQGTVINAKVFSRKGAEMDERHKGIQDKEIKQLLTDRNEEIRIIRESALSKLEKMLVGKKAASRMANEKKKVLIKKGDTVEMEHLKALDPDDWKNIPVELASKEEDKLSSIVDRAATQIDLVRAVTEEKINRLKKGDELPPGVIKMVKVYVAMKRKLAVGDKMAGRHGNKGVLSRVLPIEDMPYMPDGTPVDIVLNPLGVPSRMNVGQILETHIGWASKQLGEKIADVIDNGCDKVELRKKLSSIYGNREITKFLEQADSNTLMRIAAGLKKGIPVASSVFDGAEEKEIKSDLQSAELPQTGQTVLFDGRTGLPFDQDVTVGVMYMMKLHHLVDDKIHARSIGPYSLVTQQPLGGKAQFGGQRLGEMEVWAMEAYGAAYSLQEFLTVKSDDIAGRNRMYEAIVKGEHTFEPGLPESFNVLIKELQSLAFNIELMPEEEIEGA